MGIITTAGVKASDKIQRDWPLNSKSITKTQEVLFKTYANISFGAATLGVGNLNELIFMEKHIKPTQIVVILIVIITIGFIEYFGAKKEKELAIYGKTTICVINDIEVIAKSPHFKYYFFVGTKKFQGSIQKGNRSRELLGRYYMVEYSIKNPENNKMYFKEVTNKSKIIKSGF